MRYIKITPAAILAALVMAGCGGGAVTPDETGTVTIELTESAFTPNDIEVVAGSTVRFVLNNTGQEEHEFMIGREVSRAPGYPDTYVTDFFHGVKVNVIGEPLMVMAGESMLTRDGEMAMEEDHDEGMSMGEGQGEGTSMEEGHAEGMAMGEGQGEGTSMEEGQGEGMAMGEGQGEGMSMADDHGMAMEEDHGFMISQAAATGGIVVEIEIPEDKVGTWEIGCFVDEGTHYEDGMKGTLTVKAAS